MSGEDLRAILGLREESLAAELAAHRLDEVSERRVLGRARRALRVRSGATAAAAAAVAAIAGVGVWALMDAHDREPLVTPPSATAVTVSASPTPTASATPSPSPTLDAPAFSTSVATGEGFLQASPMTAQLWNDVEDGWILSYWAPGARASSPYEAAVYLQNPDGARYEISHFTEEGPWLIQSVGFWEPGSDQVIAEATVAGDGHPQPSTWGTLNVINGHFEPVPLLADANFALGTAPDGSYLFEDYEHASVMVVAPDLSSVRTWALHGQSQGTQLSPDGTVSIDVYYSESGPETFEVRSAVDGTVLWSGSTASYGQQGQQFGGCAWQGWAGNAEPAIVCTWYADDSYVNDSWAPVLSTEVYRAGPDGGDLLATLDSKYPMVNIRPSGDGIVGSTNPYEPDDPTAFGVYYVDRPGMVLSSLTGVPIYVGHGIAVEDWNVYSETGSMARNLATGATFRVLPPGDGDTTGGVLLVGSPRVDHLGNW